jgi:hypothetical protein
MEVVADRLSLRWYLAYDLEEPLPDHSSLTKIRDRYGLEVFGRFFERVVELCVEAGLVWGEELFFDATKVEANASMDSLIPRFAVEAHLSKLFEDEKTSKTEGDVPGPFPEDNLDALPTAEYPELRAKNAQKNDWISRNGEQDRTIVRHRYRRKNDYRVSRTDPDASLMQQKKGASRLGYHAHYVVDGGKARVILSALVTPAEVTENQPMLDLLWRTVFRWRARPRQVTGDARSPATPPTALRRTSRRSKAQTSAPTSRWLTSRSLPPTSGQTDSFTTPSKISTGVHGKNLYTSTPTPTPCGSPSTGRSPKLATLAP